ncbi:MAG: GDSL-type esterase/lipase family protein [Verrucomicrobiales bacterium]|nr:GDSL-type esterase/lipase family protein [Verrucomicrobiota bacterium JB025]
MRGLFVFFLTLAFLGSHRSMARTPLEQDDTVVFFGDSITAAGVRPDGFISLAREAIGAAYPDKNIRLIGAGVSGNKVSDLLKRLDRDVLRKNPNVVVIYIGINDVWHWTHPKVIERGGKGTTPEDFEAGLKSIIQQVNGNGARVILCTPSVIGEKTDGSNPTDPMLDSFAAISRKVAEETGTQLLDLRKAFMAWLEQQNSGNAEKGVLTKDRVHLNAKGDRFLADLMLEALAVPPVELIPAHDRAYYSGKTEAHHYENDAGQRMPYRLFVPQGYDPEQVYPLVIAFHGAGSRGDDNLKQLQPWVSGWVDDSVQAKHPCLVLMPQCPKGKQWVDTPWGKGSYSHADTPVSESMSLAKAIVDQVLAEKSVDPARIYVMGPSMGGYATWSFAMRYPELVAAAVPICGAGDPSMADTLKDMPIWAFHGDADPVVPFSGSVEMNEAIRKAGGNQMTFTPYRGVKHDSYRLAWRHPGLVEWLFQQKKPASR